MLIRELFEDEDHTSISVAEVIAKLKTECSAFLSQTSKPFFRGVRAAYLSKMEIAFETELDDGTSIIAYRMNRVVDRQPKDMNIETHHLANEYFKKKFGWNVRKDGVFATGDIFAASEYGAPFFILPIGEFRFIWSENVHDLFSHIPQGIVRNIRAGDGEDDLYELLRRADYKDTDLEGAAKAGVETVFNCDEYYIVSINSVGKGRLSSNPIINGLFKR